MSVAALERVTKRFGALTALDDVSLAVGPGEVLALLGRNGAGKSTALAILLGLRSADEGAARLFGIDPRRAAARQLVGVALQESAFPATLRVRELVDLIRAHYVFPLTTPAALSGFGLEALADRQVGGLSGGQRRLLSVTLAFVGRPSLVVLDEPTAGLDGEARRSVWSSIREHADAGGTVLLTTHHLEEADELATRVVLIEDGSVVAEGSVRSIKAEAGLTRLTFRAPAGIAIEGAERDGELVRILTDDVESLVRRLVCDNVRLDDLEVRPLTLEEAIAARGRVP